MSKIWVLTSSYNDYDQHGDYLVTVFLSKPTVEQIKPFVGGDEKTAIHVALGGGGRINSEYCWYYLKQLSEGETYKS